MSWMRSLPTFSSLVSLAGVLGVVAGCATYHDQLVRSQQAFDQNQDERALALLRDLEGDVTRLPVPERAQYAYLRGMADYRIGHRADARHWLAVARAYEEGTPGVLPTDWKSRLGAALEEMNEVVQTDGLAALAASTKPAAEAAEPEPAADGKAKKKR